MLEKLKRVREIDGYEVVHMDQLRKTNPELFPKHLGGAMDHKVFETKIRLKKFIYLRHDKNSIAFTMKGDGNKGCIPRTLIVAAYMLLDAEEKNMSAIAHLEEAINSLEDRT